MNSPICSYPNLHCAWSRPSVFRYKPTDVVDAEAIGIARLEDFHCKHGTRRSHRVAVPLFRRRLPVIDVNGIDIDRHRRIGVKTRTRRRFRSPSMVALTANDYFHPVMTRPPFFSYA